MSDAFQLDFQDILTVFKVTSYPCFRQHQDTGEKAAPTDVVYNGFDNLLFDQSFLRCCEP